MAARFSSRPASINISRRPEYLRALQDWNARLIEAQRPIRILDAIRWPKEIEQEFFARGGRELPRVRRDSYKRLCPYARRTMRARLQALALDIQARLGDDPAGRLLTRRCRSYQDALRLMSARGTGEFAGLSREVYGVGLSDATTRQRLTRLIDFLEASPSAALDSRRMPAGEAAQELSGRLGAYFAELSVTVKLTEQLSADACAGTTYLKLRQSAFFTGEDVHLLEVHEGWAHLGTAFNGARQPVLTVLGKAFPSAAPTQEGLAVLTELVAGACHPARRLRLALRLRSALMADQGADFLDVYRFLLERGHCQVEAYRLSARVFRGSLPNGAGGFAKDLSYGLGLLTLADRLRALAQDDDSTIPLLFSGKTHVDDLADLAEFHERGLLIRGEFIPAPFRDRQRLDHVLSALPNR